MVAAGAVRQSWSSASISSSGSADPFPNGPPDAFLAAYLRDGTGGTCWPSSGGLHALLVALGFDARRGSAAMYDNLSGPIHTHGTVIVRIDGVDYWVDSSMLTDRVFPFVRGEETHLDDPLHPVRVEPVDQLWRVWWPHPFLDETDRLPPARRRRDRRALPRRVTSSREG